MQIIKWPDHELLHNGSLGVKMILIIDVSASTSLHQDYTVFIKNYGLQWNFEFGTISWMDEQC